MNLKELISKNTETVDEFNDRTEWVTYGYEHYVWVFSSKYDRLHNSNHFEKWTHEKAMEHINQIRSLSGEVEASGTTLMPTQPPQPCPHINLLKITDEEINGHTELMIWQCAYCGKDIHRLKVEK